jgi:hypothetical protein|tara:strand:+ start:97 stop:2223 length:2127 start_codon:yes stop_codon:yes gene_type:complete
MACGGAITATVLTAGAGMVGDVGGEVLKSTSGITNSIKDAATGLTGNVSMASFTSGQSAFQSLAAPSALTNTLSKVATLSPGLQSSFTNMASGLGDNVFSGGFDVFSGDALSAMSLPAGLSNVLPTGLAEAAKVMGGAVSGVDIAGSAKKFGSILGSADGFVGSANAMISAATNAAGSFAGGTFPGMDSVMSGNLTGITNALPDFGVDLGSLGQTIDFGSIGDLGSPGQLLKNMDIAGNLGPMYDKLADISIDPRIASSLGGGLSTITNAVNAGTGGLTLGSLGVDLNKIAEIGPALPNNIQGQIYNAFDGLSLAEVGDVKGILGNTQAAITKGGDLMNPQKLFPTSFSTLTAPLRTASVGDRAIYTSNGSVNAEFNDLGTDLAGALPDDLAVANGALSRSFGQIKGVDDTTATLLSTASQTAETFKDLNLIQNQTTYVEPAVVTFWTTQYKTQNGITLATGPNGTFTISDAIGYAAGYNSAAPLQQNKIEMEKLIASGAMNVFTQDSGSGSASTGIYIVMDYFIDGAYTVTVGAPPVTTYVIPAGVYGAGTYATQTLAWNAIIAAAKTLMQNFYTANPGAQIIQTNFKRMQDQQAREKLIRIKMDLDLDVVQSQDNNAIQLASNLPSYALDTTAGGTSELLERVMNFSSTGGQAAVGAMREARNLDKLATANIQVDAPIPSTPPANPGQIASSTYTVTQADAIIVRS